MCYLLPVWTDTRPLTWLCCQGAWSGGTLWWTGAAELYGERFSDPRQDAAAVSWGQQKPSCPQIQQPPLLDRSGFGNRFRSVDPTSQRQVNNRYWFSLYLYNTSESTYIKQVIQRAGQVNETVPLFWFHIVGSCIFFRRLKEQNIYEKHFKRVQIKWFNLLKQRRTWLLYHQPPCWTVSSLFLTEKVLGIFPSTEQVVLRLTQNLNHGLHLQTKYTDHIRTWHSG